MPIDIGVALVTFRAIAAVAREAGKIELHQQILDLQQTMLEAIAANTSLSVEKADLARQLSTLKDELASLRSHRDDASAFFFRGDVYWRKSPNGEEDGPFCPKCRDTEQKTVRMTERKNGFTICVGCNHAIDTPGYVRPEPRGRRYPGSGFVNGW